MYLGRIVAIGMNSEGELAAMYRVSSRSYPNREAKIKKNVVSIMPRKGFEDDINKNPYIAYNCIRYTDNIAVATNGSHTDPVFEKICAGMSVRDAFCLSLLTLDYEKDSYNTPRIAAAVDKNTKTGFLGIIRKDALIVREFTLTHGKLYYVSTYEKDTPSVHSCDDGFNASSAQECAQYVINKGVFEDFEHPVTSAAAISHSSSFELGIAVV